MNSARMIAMLAGLLALLAAPVPAAACGGDCDASCHVTVDEIVTMVELALHGGTAGCANGDANGDGTIDVGEIIVAINEALVGCTCRPPAVCGNGWVDDGEDCDDGGICIGGNRSGTTCASDDDCGLDQDGVCVGGPNDLRGCAHDIDCPDGTCRRCKPFGGDGCSASCTIETTLPFSLRTEMSTALGEPDAGTCAGDPTSPLTCHHDADCTGSGDFVSGICSRGSTAAIFSFVVDFPAALSGELPLVVGQAGDDGLVPVAIRADDVDLQRSDVGDALACVCPRVAVGATCGGLVFHRDGTPASSCTEEFPGAVPCPADLPCTAIHGPGNAGSGWIGCQGLAPESAELAIDCQPQSAASLQPAVILAREYGGPGTAYVTVSTAIGIAPGPCAGERQASGPDGQYCTDDDPAQARGSLLQVPFVTGAATTTVHNAGGFPNAPLGPYTARGAAFTCDARELGSTTGAVLAGGYAACDQTTIHDFAALLKLAADP